eukprot:COSAG01_NODE_90_length_27307_cov_734.166458_1_plen_165_part_10
MNRMNQQGQRNRSTIWIRLNQMRGLLVRPLGMSTHLEKLPRIFFPPGLPNEMVTIPAAANNAMSYISRIRNVYFGSFSGCAALTPARASSARHRGWCHKARLCRTRTRTAVVLQLYSCSTYRCTRTAVQYRCTYCSVLLPFLFSKNSVCSACRDSVSRIKSGQQH